MTPEERAEKIAYFTDQPPRLTDELKAEAVKQIRTAVAEERERCAKIVRESFGKTALTEEIAAKIEGV